MQEDIEDDKWILKKKRRVNSVILGLYAFLLIREILKKGKRLRVKVIIKEFNNRMLMVECKMINHNVATIYIFKKERLQNL